MHPRVNDLVCLKHEVQCQHPRGYGVRSLEAGGGVSNKIWLNTNCIGLVIKKKGPGPYLELLVEGYVVTVYSGDWIPLEGQRDV